MLVMFQTLFGLRSIIDVDSDDTVGVVIDKVLTKINLSERKLPYNIQRPLTPSNIIILLGNTRLTEPELNHLNFLRTYNVTKETRLNVVLRLPQFIDNSPLDIPLPPTRAIPVGTPNAISLEDIKTGNLMTNFSSSKRPESSFGRYYRKNNANRLTKNPFTQGPITNRVNYVADVMGPIKPESNGGRRTRRHNRSSSRKTRRH